MADRTTDDTALAVLGAFLTGCGLAAEPVGNGLRVENPQVQGCCALRADTITCRPRDEDGRVWFWSSWGEPIARTDRVTLAALAILEYLDARGVAL